MTDDPTMDDLERIPQPIGPRLRAAREQAGLTIEALAQRIGVEAASLEAWETGERTPRANRLVMLSGMLDVTLPWLLEGREDRHMQSNREDQLGGILSELERVEQQLSDALSTVDSLRTRLGELPER